MPPGKTHKRKNRKPGKKKTGSKFWKTYTKKKKEYHEGDCTYNNSGLGVGNFDNIFPVIMKNFEIIRSVPPMWVMMSNERINKNFRKLLNNGIGKNFWKLWHRQFSRIRVAQQQYQPANDDHIGVTQMNQMPLLAKTMQVFEHGNRYYNEMLQHDVGGDFGIWRKCVWSKKWTCIFNNNTIDKLFDNNHTIYNLLYNQNGKIKTYSMRNLINVLLRREKKGSKTRFIFASCSPLQTSDRHMQLNDYIRLPNDSSIDKLYWYSRLTELQYRIFIFIKSNAMFIKKIRENGSNNTLDYKHYDLGEVIAIAENDERRDIYIHFNAFFKWLITWENEKLFFDLPMDKIQRFTATKSITYILYYLKRNIYDGGVSPNIRITKNMDPNSSHIYNRLKDIHGKAFPNIFQEIENDYSITNAMKNDKVDKEEDEQMYDAEEEDDEEDDDEEDYDEEEDDDEEDDEEDDDEEDYDEEIMTNLKGIIPDVNNEKSYNFISTPQIIYA